MRLSEQTMQAIERFQTRIGQAPAIEVMWLFGSRANGTESSDSDYDLAVALTFDAEFDLLEEGQLDLSEHLSDSHGRKLTWGGKKKKKKKGGFWGGVTKVVKKAVSSVAVAVTPKSGLSIEVSGTGSVDLSKPKDPALSLTAAVDAEVCIVGVCFSISETILKLPKK